MRGQNAQSKNPSNILFSKRQKNTFVPKEIPVFEKVDEEGIISFCKRNGDLHRVDGPALIYPDGKEEWWLNGQLHRENEPAIYFTRELMSGMQAWYYKGQKHREDGPAVINDIGEQKKEEWYKHGQLHREDGPAFVRYHEESNSKHEIFLKEGVQDNAAGPSEIIISNGRLTREEWRIEGKLHRLDGPATVEYDESGKITDEEWYKDGQLHRTDGPAITTDLVELWYCDGSLHRDGGPAVIRQDGEKKWYQHGQLIKSG